MAASSSAASLDEAKANNVIRQVEFYFSDSNLPRDHFLRKAVEESDDGLVSLAVVCSFSRMKLHLGLDADVTAETVTEDTVLAVAEALRRSSVLRISDDGKRVGRASELLKPDEIIEQVDSRTMAASPFPYNVKLEDVQSFFAQYAKVNSVRLPRHISDKRHFCGTALVEFSEEEDAKNVMKNNLVFAGAELEIKPKKDFDVEREAEKEEYGKGRPSKNASNESPSKNAPNEGYPKGLIVAFKLKRIPADSVTDQNGADKVDDDVEGAKKEETSDFTEKSGQESEERIPENSHNRGEKSSDDVQEVNEVNTEEMIQSSDMANEDTLAESEKKGDNESLSSDDKSLSGNDKNPVLREDLKEAFQKFGTVRFVDYRMGEDSGYIRFEDSKAAEKARAFAVLADEGGLIMKNHIVTLEAVTGEAEKDYWNKIRGNQENYKANKSYRGSFSRAGRNNRGGRPFNGKRGRHSSEGFPNKARKIDASA